MISWERTASSALEALRLDTIKKKIVVFAIGATLLPSASTAWVSYVQNKRALTQKITEELHSVGRQAAREMDLWLKERFYDVRVFASSYEVSENLQRIRSQRSPTAQSMEALARLDDYLTSVRERVVDYEALWVVDSAATTVAGNGGDEPRHLPQDWLTVVRGGRSIVGKAYFDPELRRPAMTLAVPIKATDGQTLGALTAKLTFRAVERMLRDYPAGESGQVYLVDRDGTPIMSSRANFSRLMQSTLPQATLLGLRADGPSAFEYLDFDGVDVLGTLNALPQLDWAVVAEIPRAEAYAQVARQRNLTLLVVSALLMVIGSLAYLLGQIIVRPLVRLSRGAAKVAAGDLAVDLPVLSGGEVGYLTRVFNDMVARLRHGRRELDAINETLSTKNAELERLSVTDGLTGLYNRRHLMSTLVHEASRTQRSGRPFSILMVDVDHFKKYNDTFGHVAGDDVLVKVAAVLGEMIREGDCAARYGGEEFVLMLPDTALDGAAAMAERVRLRVKESGRGQETPDNEITVSIGTAEFPAHGETPEAVLVAADTALYQAKRRGRDRVARPAQKRGPQSKRTA